MEKEQTMICDSSSAYSISELKAGISLYHCCEATGVFRMNIACVRKQAPGTVYL